MESFSLIISCMVRMCLIWGNWEHCKPHSTIALGLKHFLICHLSKMSLSCEILCFMVRFLSNYNAIYFQHPWYGGSATIGFIFFILGFENCKLQVYLGKPLFFSIGLHHIVSLFVLKTRWCPRLCFKTKVRLVREHVREERPPKAFLLSPYSIAWS